jgi:hypothetical protein
MSAGESRSRNGQGFTDIVDLMCKFIVMFVQ